MDTNILKKETWKEPSVVVSTTIPANFWHLAKENNILLKEALLLGLQIMFAEKDYMDYPDCKLYRNMKQFQESLELEMNKNKVNEVNEDIKQNEKK
jgi:hypothetical protein